MFNCSCLDIHGNTINSLTQWDLNQTIYIEEHGFSTAPEIHFCNKNSEKALMVMSSIEDGLLKVDVPNQLLIEPYTITLYVYLTEGESKRTVEYTQIPVRPRPMPDSFEYEDNVNIVDVNEVVEEIRALNAAMSQAEEERVVAELARIENENVRIGNETARQEAENIREENESARNEAEIIRDENEELRKASETERIENEDARKASEEERIAAENVRIENETLRSSNEQSRIDSETERETAEQFRTESETLRNDAENLRADAEIQRDENETSRQEAEVERNNAETVRNENEELRIFQEETRQTNTAIAIENAELATDRANLAAEACENIVAGTGFVSITEKGIAGGIATLDENGKVPLEQLPDDIGGNVVPEGVTYIDFDNPTGEEVGDVLPVDADTLGGRTIDYFATSDSLDTKADGLVYENSTLKLMSGDEELSSVVIVGGSGDVVLPTNVLVATDASAADIDTPNLDASTLQGYGADYFATKEDLENVGSSEELEAVISGDTQVGNAKTLEGHRASYFAPLTMLAGQRMATGTDLNNCIDIGTYYFDSLATNYANVPNSTAHNGVMNVRKWDNNRIVQEYFSINTGVMYTRTGSVDSWNPWKEVFTTNGGTINGRITLTASDNQPVFEINNNESQGWLIANSSYLGFYNNKASGWVWTSNANGTNEFRGTASENLTVDINGTVKLNGSVVQGLRQNGSAILDTNNFSSVALPKDGSVAMTGNLKISKGNGNVEIGASSSSVTLKTSYGSQFRQLTLNNPEYYGIDNALWLNTNGNSKAILHEDNIANYAATIETGTFDLIVDGGSSSSKYTLSGYNYMKIGGLVVLYGKCAWTYGSVSIPYTAYDRSRSMSGLPFSVKESRSNIVYFTTFSTSAPPPSTNQGTNLARDMNVNQIWLWKDTIFSDNTYCSLFAIYTTDD